MKKFNLSIWLFASPFIIYLITPVSVLFIGKESFYPISHFKENTITGYLYNQFNSRSLKYNQLSSERTSKHSIVALGSSRVMQFRKESFISSFFNGGGTIYHISDFETLLRSLPKKSLPNYLIIGLDQWCFNINFSKLTYPSESWDNKYSFLPKNEYLKMVYSDLNEGKFTLKSIWDNRSKETVGLSAILYNSGFRHDGSMYYGKTIKELLANDSSYHDYNFKDTFSRIKKRTSRFQEFHEVQQSAVLNIDTLLLFCYNNGIKVLGFLPPFASVVYTEMKKEDYEGIDDVYPNLEHIFKKYNFELFNFTHYSEYQSNDSEFIDGFHGSEVTYAKILLSLAEKSSILKGQIDTSKIKNALKNKINRYECFDNDF
jgi:hypothetical protein